MGVHVCCHFLHFLFVYVRVCIRVSVRHFCSVFFFRKATVTDFNYIFFIEDVQGRFFVQSTVCLARSLVKDS